MSKRQYQIEREVQCEFFDNYDISYNNASVLGDNTDKAYNKKSQFQN